MKTVLVPTDFSKPADNAALYAVHIASYLKANIELCHAFFVPVDTVAMGQVGWPLYDYDTLKQEALLQLDKLLNVMEREVPDTADGFCPAIVAGAEASGTVHLIVDLVKKKQAGMVVMGISGSGAVTKFFAGSTSRELIGLAHFPVLLVPPAFVFKPIKKIAFASDLSSADIKVIHALAGFARYFNAEIVIVHVDSDSAEYDAGKADVFLNEVTCKINYDKIYYREISSSSVNDGLQWLSDHHWVDLLVMVHRKGTAVDRLFKGSLTKKQADRVKIPLLVLPEGLHPVF